MPDDVLPAASASNAVSAPAPTEDAAPAALAGPLSPGAIVGIVLLIAINAVGGYLGFSILQIVLPGIHERGERWGLIPVAVFGPFVAIFFVVLLVVAIALGVHSWRKGYRGTGVFVVLCCLAGTALVVATTAVAIMLVNQR